MDIKKLDLSYPRFEYLINDKPSKTQYSKGVKVMAWDKNKLTTTGYNKTYEQ